MTPSSPTEEVLDRLFAAILVNDVVDDGGPVPPPMRTGWTREQFAEAHFASLELWRRGFDVAFLRALAADAIRGRKVPPDRMLAFKHVRAKCKHLRFAYVLYGADHRCPPVFKLLTTVMGLLQDALRTGRAAAALRSSVVLMTTLSGPGRLMIARETSWISLSDGEGFLRFLREERNTLQVFLACDQVTRHAFHAARKVVSRQMSFYDDMRTLHPAPDLDDIAGFLADLNGTMGRYHDRLVEGANALAPESSEPSFRTPGAIVAKIGRLIEIMDV